MAPDWLAHPVLVATVVTWVAATVWIVPLIYFGLHRISQGPELLQFAGVWWSLVFPLGMYSAATYAMAAEISKAALLTVSLVFFSGRVGRVAHCRCGRATALVSRAL
ncbi:hypothetical protein [Mycobacterium sp.]|uniref:SLAC1 family transporter n=1 Tax=Mycobacterium sp. TaxID=1785 RepID=UPI0025E673A6|nr:hypothetical protein [Mycobacterium sp.]